jgi:hypothetical protein
VVVLGQALYDRAERHVVGQRTQGVTVTLGV